MISVIIADDQALVRGGFRALLDAQADITVLAEASDGEEALRLANEHRPDVILMDVRMPGTDGLIAARRIAEDERLTGVKVVMLTTFDLDEYVYTALRNGASGFLLKDAGAGFLVEAVRAAARGDALVSPQVTVRLLAHFASAPAARQPFEPLTEREEEVLKAVARGLTNAEIAETLYISLATVKTHIAHIQAKLGARNRVELAAWAWSTGRMAS